MCAVAGPHDFPWSAVRCARVRGKIEEQAALSEPRTAGFICMQRNLVEG